MKKDIRIPSKIHYAMHVSHTTLYLEQPKYIGSVLAKTPGLVITTEGEEHAVDKILSH